jgi:hypothetical protein
MGAAAAVIDVLHAKPVPDVHCNALDAVEQEGTDRPDGVVAVNDPSN